MTVDLRRTVVLAARGCSETVHLYSSLYVDHRDRKPEIKPFEVIPPEYFLLDPLYQKDPDAPLPAFMGIDPGHYGDDNVLSLSQKGWRLA